MGQGGGFQVGLGRGAHFMDVRRLLSHPISLSHALQKRYNAPWG